MSETWISHLSIDPIPALLSTNDEALIYFSRRDLLDAHDLKVDTLWHLPSAVRLVKRQQPDGSWKHSGSSDPSVPGQNYSLLETFRNLRELVEMYGFDRTHPTIEKAAEYILGCQTDEGDIRGIIGNQYMPYYHGAILELLIKAGYEDDPRVINGLEWLMTVRQDDGGWIIPTQAIPTKDRTMNSGLANLSHLIGRAHIPIWQPVWFYGVLRLILHTGRCLLCWLGQVA